MSAAAAFTFNEDTHTYQVDGRVVPGCTRILEQAGMINFDHVNRDILERKSELGSAVHKACHLFNLKRSFTCDEQVRGYLNSWKETARVLKFEARMSEYQLVASVNGMLYGMQIDAEGLVRGAEAILDYKIGVVMAHHAIQLAGYAAGLYHPRLETAMARFRSRKRIIVKLQEDGSLAKIYYCEETSDFDVFVSALQITYWKMKHDKSYREKP